MRDYAKVAPTFWTGKTGRAIRGDVGTQILALYLMSSPHASMTGIYHCPVVYMAHETGIPLGEAEDALRRLIDLGFCVYDDGNELVWVCEMARFQIGDELKEGDRRITGIERELDQVPSGEVKRAFLERYKAPYRLGNEMPEAPWKGHTDPLRSQEQAKAQEQAQAPRAPVTDPVQEDWDGKVREYLEAVGRHATADPNSLDISPLTALIQKGYDWHRDILPAVAGRARTLTKPVSPRYFVPIISEQHQIPEKPKPEQREETEWVPDTDPRWAKVGVGRKAMPTKDHPGEKGGYIPVSELAGLMPPLPKFLDRSASPEAA